MTTPEQDHELLILLRDPAQRERGFMELMKIYKRPLYAMVRRIVVGHEDTYDVVQTTFVKVYRKLDSFQGNSKLSTWMYSIARNAALDHLRKESRMRKVALEDVTATRMEGLVAHSAGYSGDEIQLRLQQAVSRLPQKQQEVFNFRYFDEMPYAQIAEVTGTSVGGLKANYHLAVKKLKVYVLETPTNHE